MGFADDVGAPAAGGGGDELDDGAAVRYVAVFGRTDEVGVGGDVRDAVHDETAGGDKLVVGEGFVEAEDDVVGPVGGENEAVGGELGGEVGGTEEEDAGAGFFAGEEGGGGFARCEDVGGGGRPAHVGEFVGVMRGGPRRVIGEEEIVAPAGGQIAHKIERPRQQALAEVEGAVHIEEEATDTGKLVHGRTTFLQHYGVFR